jgi:hypothetical protein
MNSVLTPNNFSIVAPATPKELQLDMSSKLILENFTYEDTTQCPSTIETDSTNTNTQNLYNTVCAENKDLQTTIKNIRDTYSTDDSKQIYKHQEVSRLQYINTILFYLYIICGLILLFFLIKNKTFLPKIIGIILCVILYPFIIFPIESFL